MPLMEKSRLYLSFTSTLLLSTSNKEANIVDLCFWWVGWVGRYQMRQLSQSMSVSLMLFSKEGHYCFFAKSSELSFSDDR